MFKNVYCDQFTGTILGIHSLGMPFYIVIVVYVLYSCIFFSTVLNYSLLYLCSRTSFTFSVCLDMLQNNPCMAEEHTQANLLHHASENVVSVFQECTLKKAIIHQATTMLATSKNVLFPGRNHLLTTGTDNPTL